jgi:alpha-mannosidase
MKRTSFFAFVLSILIFSAAVAGEKPVVNLSDINTKGYISKWLVIGKFSPGIPGGFTGMVVSQKASLTNADYLTDHGGETGIEPEEGMQHKRGEGTVEWHAIEEKGSLLDLGAAFGKSNECVMYAAAYIHADAPASLFFEMQSLSGTAVFANHKLAHRSPAGQIGEVGKEKFQVLLDKGTNLIIIKFGGLRFEKAATMLDVSLDEVRGFVRDSLPSLAGTSGLAIDVHASPLKRVGSSPIFVQTNLNSSGHFQGAAKAPKMEITFIVTNISDSIVNGVSVKVTSPGLKSEASSKVSVPPNSYGTTYLALPVSQNLAGKTFPAEIIATTGGQSAKIPVSIKVPDKIIGRDQAIYYIPGFHADSVWIEDQRDYSVALIGSSRQNMLLCMSDPGYGVYMSELDSLKPFYDIYPEYRDLLKDYIKQGRIQTGGSYNQPVEKLISGEGLVRNILYGKLFQGKVLGADPRVYMGWDIFGHVPQLSQIISKFGDYGAIWSKGIWGFPPIFHHMSLDGTQVLHKRMSYGTRVSGIDTLRPFLYGGFEEFKTYGIDYDARLDCGDFKPPTPWIPGNTTYLRGLLPSIDVTGNGGNLFFSNVIKEEKEGRAHIPVTSRDMGYYHQGTALTRESLKTGNRIAENSIVTAEKFATIASLFGAKYPDKALDKAWRQLLFGQHHDALTGTINDRSYVDLMQGYRESAELAAGVTEKAIDHIGKFINTTPPVPAKVLSVPIAVFNSLNWDRTDVAHADIDFGAAAPAAFIITDSAGKQVPFEIENIERGTGGGIAKAKVIFIAGKVPQTGYSVYFARAAEIFPEGAERILSDSIEISNDFYTLKVDPARGGGIVSLIDKTTGKEIINTKNGVGNDIAAISENPGRNEPPWEIFTTNQRSFSSKTPAKVTSETGPVSARLRIEGTVGKTGVIQEIILYRNVRRIDFITHIVSYKQRDELFVATFPVSVENAVPVFEDRYGVVVRKKSRGKLNFQTWQMNNYSDHFAYASFQWLDQSQSGLIEFKDGDGQRSASFPLGMMGIVTDHSPAALKASEKLMASFVKKGILSTPWYDDGDKARQDSIPVSDSTYPKDMNFDLSFGTSFRVSLNSGGDNIFTSKVFSLLDKSVVDSFNKKVHADGYAYMLVLDPTSSKDWPAVPLLIIKAVDEKQLARAAEALASDFDKDAVITLPDTANSTGSGQQIENYGVALLNKGNVLNSIENDGTMTIALMHTASFFRRLPFELVPENRTATFPYALYPHQGDWRKAGMYRRGFEYNNPLIARQLGIHSGTLPVSGMSFLTVEPDNIVVTAMKPRGNPTASLQYTNTNPAKSVTLRLYEATGMGANVKIRFFTGIKDAVSTNLLEESNSGSAKIESGVLKDAVTPFSIRTYAFTPQNLPKDGKPANLGPETEPYHPIYTRFWMHNDGAAPFGFMPVSLGIRGNIQTDIQIKQGGVTINEFEVFVTNDYTDRTVKGTINIDVPFDWNVIPGSIDYEVKPGGKFSKKVVLAFLGEGRDGIIKAHTMIDGYTIQDVLEVGSHTLEVSAERNGDTYLVKVKNPNNQSIEGELYLVTPQETWGERLTGEFALGSITPRVQGFSAPARGESSFEFKMTTSRSDIPRTEWAVVKCAYNGKVIYMRVE